jgi:glycosyltransferase involved in cell wall biosynthesis
MWPLCIKNNVRMKIGIIARGLTKGGVTRYVTNLLRALAEAADRSFTYVVFTDDPTFTSSYPNVTVCYIPPGPHKLYWDYVKLIPYLQREKVAAVWYPKSIIPITHTLFNFKKLIVVHDLAYFEPGLHEYKLLDTLYMKSLLGFSCWLADSVIAVSHATKLDLQKILRVAPEKIVVIPEGAEVSFRQEHDQTVLAATHQRYAISSPFIFYCGSLSPRKNLLRALQAFAQIKDLVPHHVYIASGQSWHDAAVKRYIREELADRVHLIGYVTDTELVALYSSAALFLYPSLYEGFGLPIIEAQACGCIVLTSERGACAEVAGDGAVLVDPQSVPSIQAGMLSALTDTHVRTVVGERGTVNAERFTWAKTADATIVTIKLTLS